MLCQNTLTVSTQEPKAKQQVVHPVKEKVLNLFRDTKKDNPKAILLSELKRVIKNILVL